MSAEPTPSTVDELRHAPTHSLSAVLRIRDFRHLWIGLGLSSLGDWLGLFAILPILGKHRGWTHTYWAMLLIPSPLLVLPMVLFPEAAPLSGLPFYGAAVVGYFSHLFMDGMVIPFGRRSRSTR